MDNVNQITAECFNALRQLRELDGPIRSPETIHERLTGFIEAMREKAREQGMPQRDADDIAYAIVALADEIALGKAEPLRGFWMNRLLQLQFFNESLAGEGFFTRLQQIRRDGRRPDVLRVYYQCLLFGLQGKYSIRGGELELMKMIDQLRPEVERNIEVPDAAVARRRAARRAAGAARAAEPVSVDRARRLRRGHRGLHRPARQPGPPGLQSVRPGRAAEPLSR